MKKAYFACPLAGDRDKEKATEFVLLIEEHGYEILDRHVIAPREEMKEVFCKNSGLPLSEYSPHSVRKQDLEWVLESEVMVLDFTKGSWGGGIELHHATVVRQLLGLNPIPILCLIECGKRKSYLIAGLDVEFTNVRIESYIDVREAKDIIVEFLSPISVSQ